MVCLGIEPGAAGWKARTNPLSYGGTPTNPIVDWGKQVTWDVSIGTICGSKSRVGTRFFPKILNPGIPGKFR